MNNFEKIKAMDIDEMARWLGADTCNFCVYQKVNCDDVKQCKDDIKLWLESEVREMNQDELIKNLGGEHETMVAACKLFARILSKVAEKSNDTEINFKVGEVTDNETGNSLGKIQVLWNKLEEVRE